MVRLIALAAAAAVLATGASAGSLETQRRAVEAKLRAGGGPAIPTGIETAGSTYYLVNPDGTTRNIDCNNRARRPYERQVAIVCGWDGNATSDGNDP